MLQKTVLTAEDLAALLAGVWEYNVRGPLVGLTFYGPGGEALPVAWCEVASEAPPLTIRTKPETSQESLDRLLYPPVADPYQVAPPASPDQLRTA